jgi:hypothetical protein
MVTARELTALDVAQRSAFPARRRLFGIPRASLEKFSSWIPRLFWKSVTFLLAVAVLILLAIQHSGRH